MNELILDDWLHTFRESNGGVFGHSWRIKIPTCWNYNTMDITKEMQDIFLADPTTHATTATAGLARISIEKYLRYLLPTHTSCWNAPWKTFSPIWIGFCFRVCLVLPHSSGVSVTSSSAAPVLWYRYDYDCHYHLSYDVTRRSGLRDPLATQPTARASTRPCFAAM